MELITNNLNVVWFILLCVLFSGFFLLEGFDYGTGILMPIIGKTDTERRQMINALGPVWDSNQVWMITAGGAMFASFPNVYATLFSGFYLALFLMLVVLIARGIAFEFRSKSANLTWRKTFDACIFIGSLVPALLWGVTVGNLIHGTPIDASMTYVGSFWDLLNPYALLCGLGFVLVFTFHGGLYTSIKTKGAISERARAASLVVGIVTMIGCFALFLATFAWTDMFHSTLALVAYVIAANLLLVAWIATRMRHTKCGFIFSSLTVIMVTVAYFAGLFPRIMVSSLDPAWSLTIENAASSPYTLALMTVVALVFVPIVLLYKIWTYYTFRQRVSEEDLHY